MLKNDVVMMKKNESEILPFIDIERAIEKKNPRLLKVLPVFLINYLKRILHEDALNNVMYKCKDNMGLDFTNAILDEFNITVNVINKGNIDPEAKYIVAANHPLGGMDSLALMNVVGEKNRNFKFIVNDILMGIENMRPLFVPVNKHGRNAKDVVEFIDKTYASDDWVLLFPAGLVSRKKKGEIKDLAWQKSFIGKARKYKRDILPVYIDGRNSDFFYNLSNLRNALGIKLNLEMLYLVDEVYKQKNNTINIVVGKPVSFEEFDRSRPDIEWAAMLKDNTYKLKSEYLRV